MLSGHPEARLVVIDTLAKVRSERSARGQNVYAEDYGALETLLPIAAEHGAAKKIGVLMSEKLSAKMDRTP